MKTSIRSGAVVFAEPEHAAGRALLADVLEQLGFGSENGTWRSAYLSGALELRSGNFGTPIVAASADVIAQLPLELFFDAVAVQVNGPAAWDLDLAIRWEFPDHDATYRTTLHNGVFSYVRDGTREVSLTVTVPKPALGLLAIGAVPGASSAGLTLDGAAADPQQLLSVLHPEIPHSTSSNHDHDEECRLSRQSLLTKANGIQSDIVASTKRIGWWRVRRRHSSSWSATSTTPPAVRASPARA